MKVVNALTNMHESRQAQAGPHAHKHTHTSTHVHAHIISTPVSRLTIFTARYLTTPKLINY